MKKYAAVLMKEIRGNTEAKWFADGLTEKTAAGFEVEGCGVTDSNVAWAIFTKPAESAVSAEPVEPEKPVTPDEPEKPEEPLRWLDGEICKRIASTTLEPTLDEVRYKIWMEALELVREARRRAGR